MTSSHSPTKMSSKENLTTGKEGKEGEESLVLHQFPRSHFAPNLSPFALKLETYIRMTKVPYTCDFSKPQAAETGKCPWISYKGKDVADSAMCIEFLKTNTGVDLNANLTKSEKAVGRAFQKLIEEELSWTLVLWRWTYDKEETLHKMMGNGKVKSFFMRKFGPSVIRKYAHGHGIGRHSQAEVMKIGEEDIRAVGEFLGSKKYFMGETLSEVDCAVFGLFAEIVYVSQTFPLTSFVREKYPNIVEYCDRIKAEVWPDWEELCIAAKPVEKEKEKKCSIKCGSNNTAAVDAAAGTPPVVNGNGNHAEETPVQNNVNGTVIVKEIEHAMQTGDVVTKNVEFSKTVVEADGGNKENSHPTNGTNGFHHQEINGEAVPAV